jgi:hypothetical protein
MSVDIPIALAKSIIRTQFYENIREPIGGLLGQSGGVGFLY